VIIERGQPKQNQWYYDKHEQLYAIRQSFPFKCSFLLIFRIPTHLNLPKPFIQYYNSLSSELSIYTFDKPHLYSYAFEDFHASLHSSFPSNPRLSFLCIAHQLHYSSARAQFYIWRPSTLFLRSCTCLFQSYPQRFAVFENLLSFYRLHVSGRCCSGRKSAHSSYFRFYTFYVEKSRRRPGLWENLWS